MPVIRAVFVVPIIFAVLTTIPALGEEPLRQGIPQDWFQTVSASIAAQEYQFSMTGGGWGAPNRAQGLRTRVDESGFGVGPRSEDMDRFEFRIVLASVGRSGEMDNLPRGVVRTEGPRLFLDRGLLEEWLFNTPQGLEHGATLPSRRPGEGPLVLTLHLEGSLRAVIDEERAVSLREAGGHERLRYAGLAVRDARGDEVPARFEGTGDELAIVIDDGRATYPLTVDPLLSAASWSRGGGQAGAQSGTCVSTVGDVNGDGYSDVIVGAPYFDGFLLTNAGRAEVYFGSAQGLATTPSWSVTGSVTGLRFGISAAAAGDINGDGIGDFIVGSVSGKALIYTGSANGLSTIPTWLVGVRVTSDTFTSQVVNGAGDLNSDGYDDLQISDGAGEVDLAYGGPIDLAGPQILDGSGLFGKSLAWLGDADGNGYDDFAVGWPDHSGGGAVYIYYGGPGGLSGPYVRTGASIGAQGYGTSVSGAGDFNGDGYADMVVGAPDSDIGGTDAGLIELVLGGPSGLNTGYTVTGAKAGNRYGQSVASAGDVDGDGLADFIAGEPGYDGLFTANIGRVSVFEGRHLLLNDVLAPATTRIGATEAAQFGQSVSSAGDVNGDGFGDVIIGAPLDQVTLASEGRAFVYHGSPNGLADASGQTLDVPNPALSLLGQSVASAGDVNGDGYTDVVVGAPDYDHTAPNDGCIFLYRGSKTGLEWFGWSACGSDAGMRLGMSVAGIGDVNDDGYDDFAAGAPDADTGATDIGVVKVWYGGPGVPGTGYDWIKRGLAAFSRFGDAVGGTDANGDGFADLLVGSPGRVSLYYGGASGLSLDEGWFCAGGSTFGHAVAGAGDVNADGFGDIVIGEPGAAQPAADAGAAYIYLGSNRGPSSPPWRTWRPGQGASFYGQAVGSACDVNGDGYSDVFVTADRYDATANGNEGRVEVFLGSASGPGATASWSYNGDRTGGRIGFTAACAGDVNDDGYSDLAVGSPFYANAAFTAEGRVMVFHGASTGLPTSPSWSKTGTTTTARLGQAIASGVDANGDGFADLVYSSEVASDSLTPHINVYFGAGKAAPARPRFQTIALFSTVPVALGGMAGEPDAIEIHSLLRNPAGRTAVRLEGEAKKLGVPFDGTGHVVTSASFTGVPDNGSVAERTMTLGSLERQVYRWRVRILGRDPRFPRSPWLHLAGNARTEADIRMNGAVAPAGVQNLRVTKDGQEERVAWDAVFNAATYDVQRGALGALRASGGDFSLATKACVANDLAATWVSDGTHPAPGNGLWYLLRAVNAFGAGTYDEGGAQAGARDAGIAASPAACP